MGKGPQQWKYFCSLCGTRFKTLKHKFAHMLAVHGIGRKNGKK